MSDGDEELNVGTCVTEEVGAGVGGELVWIVGDELAESDGFLDGASGFR